MVTAPHHLAADAGRDVLREGGSAVEAMVAAAAVIAVVYPHMNAIGGDGFWLIAKPGCTPTGIDACGPAAQAATRAWYREQDHTAIPTRGPLAALTVPGTIGGWAKALAQPDAGPQRLGLKRLLAPAIEFARHGVPITTSQAEITQAKHAELFGVAGFAPTFLSSEQTPPPAGAILRQPKLADTLEQLGKQGLDDFYRGDLAASMANDLAQLGSPLALDDFTQFQAKVTQPLSIRIPQARLFNMPPPTQGLASLFILGAYARLNIAQGEGFEHIHGLIEATKAAFRVRDAHVSDPRWMTHAADALLAETRLKQAARAIDPNQAAPWPHPAQPGDTVWMGAMDAEGRSVSFIQSIYWEYGSGLVLPTSGVLMQNRGTSFSLNADARYAMEPGRYPFHTLNPAMAQLSDGRQMAYGTMGGEGQPQTQAAVFSRYALYGMPLQQAVSAPRWLLGRTWGKPTTSLKVESRLSESVLTALERAGHDVERVAAFDSMMGHAGAIVGHPDGLQEGAADPRSDGHVATV